MQVDFYRTVGSVFIPELPPFTNDTTILYDTSSNEVQTAADLDNLEIEFLTDGLTAKILTTIVIKLLLILTQKIS